MTVFHHPTPALVINREKGIDDDVSLHSTQPMERTLPKKSLRRPSLPNVSFNLDKNIEYKSNDITEGETSHLWYSADDFKEFKKSFVILAKEFQAYNRTMPEQQSFKTFLLMAFNACCDESSEDPRSCLLERCDEKVLQKWLSKGSRRGIERLSVLSIFADKSSRKKKLTAAVLDSQDSCSDMTYDESAEYIRKAARKISRPSRLFAWRLAF
eukprot:scaffold5317_cov160-Amphora_coffeaeformis.AAC.1